MARHATFTTFSRDGTHLAVMYRNGPVHLRDLRLIRSELAEMKLGWDLPPYPPAPPRLVEK